MISMRTCNAEEKSSKGFTLIELIVVISIIAILCTIAVPAYTRYRKVAKEQVCNTNCLQLERIYQGYLAMEGIEGEYSEILFPQYLEQYDRTICPVHGVIDYKNGRVQCKFHSKEARDGEDNGNDGSVPFL